jgi:hypothetical protein
MHPPEQPGVVLQVYVKRDFLFPFIIPFENPNSSLFSLIPNIKTFSSK